MNLSNINNTVLLNYSNICCCHNFNDDIFSNVPSNSVFILKVTLKSTGQIPVVLILISKTAVAWSIKSDQVTIHKVHVSDLQYKVRRN